MSSTTIASFLATNQKIIVYMGIPILILGLIGNLLNSIVLLSLKTFRQSSCAFYLTILSIVNLGQLLSGLLTRIMISGYLIDWTQISLVFCKFRTFAFQTTTMISYTCISLATIDQYLATCSRRECQRWNHIKIAHRIIIIAIIICILVQSPCLVFYDFIYSSNMNSSSCTIINNDFIQFNTYFNYLFLGNIFPYLITYLFGFMAYRNIQDIAYRTVPLIRRELDKQLTRMVLIQILYTCISILPNTILYFILSYGNVQNPLISNDLHLAYTLSTCLYYTYFSSPFYIYMCTSERYRRQFFHVLFNLYLKQCKRHQIIPE